MSLLESVVSGDLPAAGQQVAPAESAVPEDFESFAKQFLKDHEDDASVQSTAPPQPEPEPAPAPKAEPPAPTAQEQADSWAKLRETYGKKYADDAALAEGALNAMKAISQRNELAQLGRVLQENPALVAQHLPAELIKQARPELFSPPPEPTPANAPGAAPAPLPEGLPENVLRYLTLAEGAPEAVKATVAAWMRDQTIKTSPAYKALESRLNELQAAIPKTNGQHIDPNQIAAQSASQALAAIDQDRFIERFWSDNAKWIFSGGDPTKGVTADGVRFAHHLAAVKDRTSDPELAVRMARMLVDEEKRSTIQPSHAPNKPAAQHKANVAAPSFDPGEITWDDTKDFAGNFEAIAAKMGASPAQLYAV